MLARPKAVLLDFLAPRLLTSAFHTTSRRPTANRVRLAPSDANVIFERLAKQTLHSSRERSISDDILHNFNTVITQLRRTIHRNSDVHDGSLVHWRLLERHNLGLLGPSHIDAISSLLAADFVYWRRDLRLKKEDLCFLQDIALATAAKHSTNALVECMLYHIRARDSASVISLYNRFFQLVGDEETREIDKDPEEGDIGGLTIHTPRDRSTLQPGRVSILLAVTTAYAMRGTFSAALKTSLATKVRLHNPTIEGFLRHLSHDAALQAKVVDFVHRFKVARKIANPFALSKHISYLTEISHYVALQDLYRSVISGLSGSEAYIAIDESSATPKKPVFMTQIAWTAFFSAFLKTENQEQAAQMWDDMMGFNCCPATPMWNTLIDSYAKYSEGAKRAIDVWNMMLAQNVKPDGHTHRAVISALFKGQNPQEAMKRFRSFQTECGKMGSDACTLEVYNAVIRGLLSFSHLKEANNIMHEMYTTGPKPDVMSYNSFIGFYARQKDLKSLAAVVNKMSSQKVVGDVTTFSTILSALLRIGRTDAISTILDLMHKLDVKPNVVTYTAIIDAQLREQDETNLQAAFRLLQKMEQNPESKPNDITYSAFLSGIYRGSWLSSEKAEMWRKELTERMKRQGVLINAVTYSTLIKGCLENPHPEGLQNALAYYQEMKERNYTVTSSTWYVLLAGLLQRGEWLVADEIVREMRQSSELPSNSMQELVRKVRNRTRF